MVFTIKAFVIGLITIGLMVYFAGVYVEQSRYKQYIVCTDRNTVDYCSVRWIEQ